MEAYKKEIEDKIYTYRTSLDLLLFDKDFYESCIKDQEEKRKLIANIKSALGDKTPLKEGSVNIILNDNMEKDRSVKLYFIKNIKEAEKRDYTVNLILPENDTLISFKPEDMNIDCDYSAYFYKDGEKDVLDFYKEGNKDDFTKLEKVEQAPFSIKIERLTQKTDEKNIKDFSEEEDKERGIRIVKEFSNISPVSYKSILEERRNIQLKRILIIVIICVSVIILILIILLILRKRKKQNKES